MPPADDIKGLDPGSRTEHDEAESPARPPPTKTVGPESEVRGGPEAPEDED